MIFLATGEASAIQHGDIVFYRDKSLVGYAIVEEVVRNVEGISLLGRAFPEGATSVIDLRMDEQIGIVRGVAPGDLATFGQFMKTSMPDDMRGARRLAEEARR
jgi:hypothetical protein